MTLLDLKRGKIVEIVGFDAGRHAIQKLHSMGLYKNQKIRIIGNGPFYGPVLIEDIKSGSRLALGRGLASKVLIEERDDETS